MPTSFRICSKLLQSSFLTFHYWWRGNSVYWRDNSRRSHCCSNLCHSYNTACSHASRHHLSWWFFYKKQLLTQMTSQLLVNHSTGGIHYVSSVPNWLLSWRWKTLAYYKRKSSFCGRYFCGTSIEITADSQQHLGAVMWFSEYKRIYIHERISQWIKELQMLCKIAWFEPQAAYSCFITGFKDKPTFYMKTIPNISSHLKRLDEVIPIEFTPAITGGIICSDIERKLMSLLPNWVVWESQFFRT